MNQTIPGVLTVTEPQSLATPVVFDSPHSGTVYPDDFRFAAPPEIIRMAVDTFVDELFGAAPDHGAVLVSAHFPRAYIDANRPSDDIDPSLLAEPWPGKLEPGEKTKSGIGLIWRQVRPGIEVYDRKLSVAEVKARIERYHQPYHETLGDALQRAHAKFGAVWHVNCHSMPATSDVRSPEGPGCARPDFSLGDRDGTTCDLEFTNFVSWTLRQMGYVVAINAPYKGVELVRAFSDPAARKHSLQIEINRKLYMDEITREKNAGFEILRADISKLVDAICQYARSHLA
jgi:N-formylglutamate deformylase